LDAVVHYLPADEVIMLLLKKLPPQALASQDIRLATPLHLAAALPDISQRMDMLKTLLHK
jgi:ankyrin repeat protein